MLAKRYWTRVVRTVIIVKNYMVHKKSYLNSLVHFWEIKVLFGLVGELSKIRVKNPIPHGWERVKAIFCAHKRKGLLVVKAGHESRDEHDPPDLVIVIRVVSGQNQLLGTLFQAVHVSKTATKPIVAKVSKQHSVGILEKEVRRFDVMVCETALLPQFHRCESVEAKLREIIERGATLHWVRVWAELIPRENGLLCFFD